MLAQNVFELLGQGLQLMLIGMGSVFLFLGLLVFSIHGMSLAARRWGAADPAKEAATPAHLDSEVVSVITAAIHRFRANRGSKP